MLFLRAGGAGLAKLEAKPSFWSSISNSISKTTKVAAGVFAAGAAVAVSAVSFGAIPLIAGGVIALGGIGIYAYGKITSKMAEVAEKKNAIKLIAKAPNFDFTYVAPKPQAPAPFNPPINPVPAAVKQPAKKMDKENAAPKMPDANLVFSSRPVVMGKKAAPVSRPLSVSNRQALLA